LGVSALAIQKEGHSKQKLKRISLKPRNIGPAGYLFRHFQNFRRKRNCVHWGARCSKHSKSG